MIEKIMTKDLLIANIEDNIQTIADKMKQFDIGFLPIVQDKKIVGVITDRDIVTKILANQTEDPKIADYMTKTIISVSIDSDITTVLTRMKKHRIKRILITDNEKVVGIVSLSDIVQNCDLTEEIIDTLKQVFEINRNSGNYRTEIDEFYL